MAGKWQHYLDSWIGLWQRVGFKTTDGTAKRSSIEGEDSSTAGGGEPPKSTSRVLLLLIILGMALMMWGQRGPVRSVDADPTTGPALPLTPPLDGSSHDTAQLERNLTAALNQMSGVGTVKVLIVPETSEEKIFAEEVTTRTSTAVTGGAGHEQAVQNAENSVTRRPVLVRMEGGRTEEPLVQQIKRPKIAGVLIVADGAEDARVRRHILEAVTAALGIPPHRIEVVPKK